jgi:prepilin-type N-terminal cleavage/methylation domain-containing protein
MLAESKEMVKPSLKKLGQDGFTLLELLIVLGIFSLLIGFVTLNLGGVTRSVTVSSMASTVAADIRSQQVKAMSGSGNGNSASDFGIYFEQGRYTLFTGSTYTSSNSTNFVVNLDSGLVFSNISFPASTIIFSQRAGEISGYSSSSSSITLASSTGSERKTIHINQYGVIDSIN